MEPANIDWNNVVSVFVEDSLYEHINAPKWVDFSAPDDHVDDEAWFCKADCRHPKTAEDFKVKHFRSLSTTFENLPLRDRKIRDGSSMSKRLNKARTFNVSEEDQENENPNFSTPSKNKSVVKPALEEEKGRKLKSTASASNLFAGRDILNQITEFCSELKKMVMKGKEVGEDVTKKDGKNELKEKLLQGEPKKKPLPLGEIRREKTLVMKTPPPLTMEEKRQRRIKREEKENSPITLDLKAVGKGKDEKQRLLQVRTNPPSPQCFSADREPLRRPKLNTTPLKPSRTIPLERGVHQEVEESNRQDSENAVNVSVAGKETRTMEMFWILKPCLAK